MDKISIIIPIYNCEKYLDDCINSVLSQNYENIEVILVDDGSIDNSSQMCDYYASVDKRIIVLHKKNGGACSARNSGIKLATGKWIMILDADDKLISDNFLNQVYSDLHEVDLVIFNYTRNEKYKDSNELVRKKIVNSKIIESALFDYQYAKEKLSEDVKVQHSLFVSSWTKLYKREVIMKHLLEFPIDLILSDDAFFNFKYLSEIEKVLLVDKTIYFYRENNNSITSSYGEKHFNSHINIVSKLLDEKILDSEINKAKEFYIIFNLLRINERLNMLSENFVSNAKKEYKKLLESKPIENILIKNKNRKISHSCLQNIYYNYIWKLIINKKTNKVIKLGNMFHGIKYNLKKISNNMKLTLTNIF